MAGFRKAKSEQAALKMGMYGLAGSGKTFTALLLAEGLAKLTKKRVAVVDTEHGTDFYTQKVIARKVHPDAFDFDAVYSRSITEIDSAIRAVSPEIHSVILIDSITHIWESTISAYAGSRTKIDTIPFHAWAKIKRPYKSLIEFLLNSSLHVIFCGRQGNVFELDEETDELRKVGTKMKSEGETPYEPHILIHMESVRQKAGDAIITAFAEKDRTGILAGKTIQWPNFDNIIRPLLPLLGNTQAQIETADATSAKDAEAITTAEAEREMQSQVSLDEFGARIRLAKTHDELKAIGSEITPALKKSMLTEHVALLRTAYQIREKEIGK